MMFGGLAEDAKSRIARRFTAGESGRLLRVEGNIG